MKTIQHMKTEFNKKMEFLNRNKTDILNRYLFEYNLLKIKFLI